MSNFIAHNGQVYEISGLSEARRVRDCAYQIRLLLDRGISAEDIKIVVDTPGNRSSSCAMFKQDGEWVYFGEAIS